MSLSPGVPELTTLLRAHKPFDENEGAMRDRTLAYLDTTPYSPFNRKNFSDGHVTASAWILDHEGTRALLFHHKKLDMWIQPGGHMDDDTDIFRGALREASEETGLIDLAYDPRIFDVDVHCMPARKDEPEHHHYDIRILMRASQGASVRLQEDEGNELRWVLFGEIPALTAEESVLRMVRKCAQ